MNRQDVAKLVRMVGRGVPNLNNDKAFTEHKHDGVYPRTPPLPDSQKGKLG